MDFVLALIMVLAAFVVVMRYIQYRERLDMLRRGLTPKGYRPQGMGEQFATGSLLPPEFQPRTTGSLQTGGLSPASRVRMQRDGVMLTMVGAALTVGLTTIAGWSAVLIPGLIILGAGVGHLINYYLAIRSPRPPRNRATVAQNWQQPQQPLAGQILPPQQPHQPNQPYQAQPNQQPGWNVPPAPAPYMGEQTQTRRDR